MFINYSDYSICFFADTLNVKLISESCDDVSGGCSNSRGHIIINGHQHSRSIRSINTVLFDYRSGIYEHRNSYDTYGSAAQRTNLANFLNGLTHGKILFLVAANAVRLDASSALALQRYGVSASFATASLPSPRCSMAAIAYTGGERKEWEQSINKGKGGGVSIIETTIYLFRDLQGKDECSQEMGIQTRRIPDSAFTAPSTWDNHDSFRPYRAKLHDQTYPGWCSAAGTPVSHFLQIDLGSVKTVTGLAIQAHGTHHGHNYITKFRIDYSADGSNWLIYKDIGSANTKVFDGIRRLEVIETRVNWFHRTMMRYFKIVPTARVSTINCLRIELYGCTPQTPILEYNGRTDERLDILALHTNSLKVYYTFPTQSKAIIGISTAADNQTLDNNIDQMHFKQVTSSITHDNGTIQSNQGIATTTTTNQLTKIDSSALVEFNMNQPNYYSFNIEYNYQVFL